jgi:hypothetical protein
MLTNLISFSILMGLLFYPLLFTAWKRKSKKIRIPKNHNDTSDAEYAINENGFLERIHHDKLTKHSD